MTREADEAFFVDANLEGEPVETLSPSGAYRLTVQQYRTKPRCWNYSRGVVTRVADGSVVADIKRNYHAFLHTFVVKNGREYLIAGRSYMSQTIVDLEAGNEYEAPKEGFCWAACELSPDGCTLLVDGCIWARPYELRFFDFTDPARGWPELRLVGTEALDERDPVPAPRWLDATTVECHLRDGHERVVLRRDGDVMRVIEHWISEDEQRRREDDARAEAEWDAWWAELRANDPLYRRFVELAREYKIPHDPFSPIKPERLVATCRSSAMNAVAHLEWDRAGGRLSVSVVANGKRESETEYPGTVAGIEAAVLALVPRFGYRGG